MNADVEGHHEHTCRPCWNHFYIHAIKIMMIHIVVLLVRTSRNPVREYVTTRLYGVMIQKPIASMFTDFETSEFVIVLVLQTSMFISGKSGGFMVSSKNLC
jgi:hypothetical protein